MIGTCNTEFISTIGINFIVVFKIENLAKQLYHGTPSIFIEILQDLYLFQIKNRNEQRFLYSPVACCCCVLTCLLFQRMSDNETYVPSSTNRRLVRSSSFDTPEDQTVSINRFLKNYDWDMLCIN